MVGKLLLRGMLVGLVAGLLTFAFLKVFGEPQVDRAIAFETQMDEAKAQAAADAAQAKGLPAPPREAEEEIVSRPTQAGIGLFTGVMVYCTAFGGLFALVFALCYGRLGDLGPRATAALLAGLGLVAVYIVPNLKYPANPPSVGDPDTIGLRTGLYFAFMALSLAATIACAMLRNRLVASQGRWNATLWAGGAYLAAMIGVAALMPAVNEVPADFPAVTLWAFRLSSLGAQVILWTALGLMFGGLTHRVAAREGVRRLDAAVI
ncbi:CbtA family protein [Lichenihabitans sp. Uapishka_5]|uniref:CbtA family protein n=1 Tax=Lichenihabitans sp. Uapishka_5 TaxID=3037302 RepID=UPI0029E7DCE5|nr:CbtA family protein [Lichenihabitans sp. Uapishka_5]MDX7951547.1 CbtA family protein [Lichenihabitans sp. Uapishka_5]